MQLGFYILLGVSVKGKIMSPFHFGWGVLFILALVAIDLLARGAALLVRRASLHFAQSEANQAQQTYLSKTAPRASTRQSAQ